MSEQVAWVADWIRGIYHLAVPGEVAPCGAETGVGVQGERHIFDVPHHRSWCRGCLAHWASVEVGERAAVAAGVQTCQ